MNGGCNCQGLPQPFVIFQGQDKTMNMAVVNQQSLLPFDLTSCTEIDVALPNADGTYTNLLLSDSQVAISSPPVAGQFTVPITNEVSLLLNVAEAQDVDVAFTIGGLITIVRFFGALTVLETPV